ncbi:peptidylprolyl isomerase [Curtanaerobium respiraculi]|uniref:peptidylprolyl isomerase n=1 Tax=Curtanaerobium respiraculi TaxID=2949669 RepID=UPI0024B353A8|nr:peptidylprolyl isomerase [Curtanaerobium respiraculi]
MNASTIVRAASTVALSAVCMFGFAACSSDDASTSIAQGAAATVNGTEVSEQTVTDYIEAFRSTQSLTDEDSWGQWMAKYSLDPTKVRQEVIDYYVNKELVKQAAKEKNVEVADSDVDEQVAKMKANYSSDDAWKAALTAAGTTEDLYRDSVQSAMLESALKQAVISSESSDPSDDEVLSSAQSYRNSFNGAKRSSHVLFSSNDEAKAQEVLDQINSGAISFEDAAKQYSTDTGSAEKGGDVGWDVLNSFVTPYRTALQGLDAGQVSGLVTSDYGIHIIKCTEVYNAPDEITSLDQIPSDLADYIRMLLKNSNASTAYQSWFADYKNNANVQTADMPDGLPYAIDMSKYETSASSDSAAASSSATAESSTSESSDSGASSDSSSTSSQTAAN